MKTFYFKFLLLFFLITQQVFADLPSCETLVNECNVGRENGSCRDGYMLQGACQPGGAWTSSQCQIQVGTGGSVVKICTAPYYGATSFICAPPYGSTYGSCDPAPPPPPPPSGGSGTGTGTGTGTSTTGGSCDVIMTACQAKVQEAISGGSLRLMQCEHRSSPASMICLADNSGTGVDARCMGCPDGKSAGDWIWGNGTSLPDFTPKSSLADRQADCTSKGGTWTSDGTTWTCTTSSSATSYDSNGNVKTPQKVELNCGGDTGIACESTQLSVSSSLKDILKFFTESAPVDCAPGTACYLAKEVSVLDQIKQKTGKVPENILNMKDLIMGTYLEPFKNDKGSSCSKGDFEPIVFSFTSIDGKVASYVQPLPGEFLCRLFGIVRIFLVTGAIIAGLRLIVTGFMISS